MENRKSRASVIFVSVDGETLDDDEYEPEMYGVLQIDNFDLRNTWFVHIRRANKACSGAF